MSLNKRLTACIITLFVLLSIFVVPLNETAKAQDGFFDADSIIEIINFGKQLVDFDNVMDPHPFRFIGAWHSNDTMIIDGDMTFNLYFSSTIITQLEFLGIQDSIKISVHHLDETTGILTDIENATVTMTLKPDILTEFIQDYEITLNNTYVELEENDSLIFAIEVIHSEKPLNDFVEKRFDTKIKPRIEKIVSLMKKVNDPDLENISIMIEQVMNNLSDLNIGGDEFGSLVNVLVSSVLYYGSSSHPSMVKFSTEEGDNHTLYFHNEPDYSFDTAFAEFGYIKTMNGTAPSVDAYYAYPPIAVNIDDIAITELNEDEWLSWLAIWALYVFEEPGDTENQITYYLHSGGMMDSTKPNGSSSQRDKLSEAPSSWIGETFDRNKILKNVTAELYIYHPKLLSLKKTNIVVELKQGNETIASSQAALDRTTLLEKIKRGADVPTIFNFENLDAPEIWYNKDLTLEISVGSAPFSLFKSPILSYDSYLHPSKLKIRYEETDNIELDEMDDKEIFAGGKIEYTLDIESKYNDILDVSIEEIDSIGSWNYSVYPSEIQIQAGETKNITIIAESKATDADAYENGDFIQLAVTTSGNTGVDTKTANVSVSEAAVEYAIELTTPEDIQIRHGSEGTFTLFIENKNKGFIADRYTFDITTEHGWNVQYVPYIENYLEVGEESEIEVTLIVPWYTTIKTEEITLEITSYESEKYETFTEIITMNVTIGEPNVFDDIYHFFENAGKAIGLDNISEKYAGWILIALLTIMVLLIALVLIILKKIKYIELVCTKRIKEISTDEAALYDITVKNPYKTLLTYEIKVETDEENSKGWDVSLDTNQLMVESEKQRNIRLQVKPNDHIRKEDWIQVKVIVKPVEKNKGAEITTVTTIKNGKVDVKMSGVFHWPRVFKKGERVETSFKLFNRGNVSAENVSIILYVNGEEKNKVENITIPRGGHADINIPWIAEKGKNEVYIVVN